MTRKKPPLSELRDILRNKLEIFCRAEGHRKREKERVRKRAVFISKPFDFAKSLLGDKRNGNLECTAKERNSFLRETLSDQGREKNLGENNTIKTA